MKLNCKKLVLRLSLICLFIFDQNLFAQCPLTPAACTGTALLASDGNKTIPSATTYYVPVGTTYTGNITFTDGTSVLCIEGTWTGKMASTSPPAGATINLYGTYSNGTAFNIAAGGLNLNIHAGASFTSAGIAISGGVNTFVNCGTITLPTNNFTVSAGTFTLTNHGPIYITSGNFLPSGGTVTIDNYSTIKLNAGYYKSTAAGVTFHNYTGGDLLAYGTGAGLSDGTFINDANSCNVNSFNPSGGTFTNNNCASSGGFAVSGGGTYTNNSHMNIYGDFTVGSATSFTNNGLMTISGNFSNTGSFTNNGTINVTGNFSNTTTFTITDKSQVTSVNWSNTGGTIVGPASGCGSFIATGVTSNTGTVSAANSSQVDIYDTGLPSAKGTPAFPLDANSGNMNSAVATGSCAVNTFGFPNCKTTCSVLLPIELISFIAQYNAPVVNLNWLTATETNNDYFTIERSADANTFIPLKTVKGAGNSTTKLSYDAVDETPLPNTSYYRLKQTDYDGKYAYSHIVAVNRKESFNALVYPNPSNGEKVRVEIEGLTGREVQLALYDALGRVVYSEMAYNTVDSDYFSTSINFENNIPFGVYYLVANNKTGLFRQMLVVSGQE